MGSRQVKPSFGKNEMERRLQLLYQITSQTKKSLNEQLNNALELTTKLLDMEIGIISSISDDSYTVRNFFPADSGLSEGQVFELGSTYCSITLQSEEVVAINHMKESEYERHPCYAAFSLEAYIGIPVIIDNEVYGTINFSSSQPRKEEFREYDYMLIKLLGEWAAATIKRARIEDDLKEKNERLELISTNSADLICLHALDGVYEYISPSVINILGYSFKELLGKNHADLIHEDDLEELKGSPYQELKDKGVVTNVRYRIKNKKDEYIWFESSVKTVVGEDGSPIGLQSISREVTDRKRLETMFEQAQEMASVGGWEFDLESGKLFWTDEVYRIHDKEIGSEVFVDEGLNYFPDEAKEELEAAISRTINTGQKYDLVLPFISEKGVNKWVRAIGKAHYESGKAMSLSGTFQDLSKQVKYEKRIIAQNEELLKLTKTRDKLYSIIAHDLKGAFFGIKGLLGILLEDIEAPDIDRESIKEKMNMVHLSAENTYELLENLLDWVKIQNGDASPVIEQMDLKGLLLNSISVFESAAVNKGVQIESQVENIFVHGDQNMLSTLVRNLISNAIKYSDKNSKVIVGIEEFSNYINIRVKDFGLGMSADVKKLLFNKEERPQRRGTMYEKGTGLGLLLCADIVEAHNGSIEVISEENKGSEFIVSIPKAKK
ncbi:MAG: PAS domain S-box protein [Balneola sp.]